MPIDPSLITDTMARWQAPAPVAIPNALQNYATLQALKTGQLQQQVEQAKANQALLDMRDAQIQQRAFQDPATVKAIAEWQPGTPFPLANLGLQYKTVQAMQDKVLADQQTKMTLDREKLAAADALHTKIGSALTGLMYDADGNKRDDAAIAADAPNVFNGLVAQGVIPQGTPAPQISGFADANRYAMQNNYALALNQYAQGAQEKAQQRTTQKAQYGGQNCHRTKNIFSDSKVQVHKRA